MVSWREEDHLIEDKRNDKAQKADIHHSSELQKAHPTSEFVVVA